VRRLILVRHGEAAAGWGDDLDPGLSESGHAQARHAAESLMPLGPLPVITSPLRRCRETAAPIAAQWNVVPAVEPNVGEIQSPDPDLSTRGAWLTTVLGSEWPELDAAQQAWRQTVLDCLLAIDVDTVVVTHFVAINAAIGAATLDPRVVCRRVGNCAATMFETDGNSLFLVAAPADVEATEVL
jgi:broad specificity phosphatase PhoE